MKMKYLFTLVTILFYLLNANNVWADFCDYNIGDYSYTSTISGSAGNRTTTPLPITPLILYSIVDCRNQITNNQVKYKNAFFDFIGSNINLSQTTSYSNTTYYKIVNTGNAYIDKYGYISFDLQYSRNSSGPLGAQTYTKSLTTDVIGEKIYFFTNEAMTGNYYESATQGVTILNLKFYFKAAPDTNVTQTVILGAIDLMVSPNTNNIPSFIGRKNIQVSLNISPLVGKTCSIYSPIVNLPTVITHSLTKIGEEVGRTNFSITTTCSGLSNMPLFYTMLDNADLTNNSNVLINTNDANNNVGIKVYNSETNTSIFYNNEYSFGTLGPSFTASLTKNFYATYYKRDNNPVSAGDVNSQATILVVYK